MLFLRVKHVLTVICERTHYRISEILEMLLPLITNVFMYILYICIFKVKTYFIIYKANGEECVRIPALFALQIIKYVLTLNMYIKCT